MILLPIHPEFVERIRSGEKRFEFRTFVPKGLKDDPLVLVYATAPEKTIIGFFRVVSVISCSPTSLWEQAKVGAGISREKYRKYFKGRAKAYALEIAQWKELSRPFSVEELCGRATPPQSFFNLTVEQRQRVLCRAEEGERS